MLSALYTVPASNVEAGDRVRFEVLSDDGRALDELTVSDIIDNGATVTLVGESHLTGDYESYTVPAGTVCDFMWEVDDDE